MNTITDAPPGTVPEWAIRYSHYEGEWLVLADWHKVSPVHYQQKRHPRFGIAAVVLGDCSCGCGVVALEIIERSPYWRGDDLAEAHAAFERIEREWLETKR